MVPRMGKMAGILKSISFDFDRFEFINRNKNLKNIVYELLLFLLFNIISCTTWLGSISYSGQFTSGIYGNKHWTLTRLSTYFLWFIQYPLRTKWSEMISGEAF